MIAAVDLMHTSPTTATTDLTTIFTNALLVDHAAFFDSAAIIDFGLSQLRSTPDGGSNHASICCHRADPWI